MYRFRDGPFTSVTNSGLKMPPPSALPEPMPIQSGSSRPVSSPPSPTVQINHLLHKTAQLIAVNAQLKKEIEHARAMAPNPGQMSLVPLQNFACDLAHSSSTSLRNLNGKKSPKPDSYKTVMCQAWLESKICLFGENCRFAHGEQELRPSKIQPKQNSKYKTKLCDKYTNTGLCPYGNRCLFIHPDNGTSANAYIRSDRLVEVSQRHAIADIGSQCAGSRAPSPFEPQTLASYMGMEMMTPKARSLRPHPSWPLEPAAFFQERTDDQPERPFDPKKLFGSFGFESTPDRVSFGGHSAGYSSGESSPSNQQSPFSTQSSSSVNLNVTDEEKDFEYFRLTGLDNLAEELTRNLTTNETW